MALPIIHLEAMKQMNARRNGMDNEFNKIAGEMRDVKDYIVPKHGRYLQAVSADQTNRPPDQRVIYKPTATDAIEVLGAGMMSGNTPRSRPWFRMGLQDQDLADSRQVKIWLTEVERRMLWVFAKSNFYNSAHTTYKELGAFGTGAMMSVSDLQNIMRWRAYTMGEYRLAINDKLRVDTFYRRYFATAGQIIAEFGEENVSSRIKSIHGRGNLEEQFEIAHAIEPNDGRFNLTAARRFGTRSVYWEHGNSEGRFLRVSGFRQFPIVAPRWDVIGRDTWGSGPGQRVLPDVKALQKEREIYLTILDKTADPPMKGPGDLSRDGINTDPGAENFTDDGANLEPLYLINGNLGELSKDIETTVQDIRNGLFTDLFLMLSSQNLGRDVTATEIAARQEEKLVMLGPMIGRSHNEMLDPAIDLTFNELLRIGQIPEPPPELDGQQLRVEYVSILAEAQKLAGAAQLERHAAFVLKVSQIQHDKVDTDTMIESHADSLSLPPDVIVPDEQVVAAREARALKEQQQQQIALAAQGAETAKTMSETTVGEGTALESALQGVGVG